jgi:hypothetical protein
MKKKTVFLLAFVAFTFLAIYAVWHYSPLRYLTKSRSQSGQTQIAALGAKNQPVVVRKKVPPRPKTAVQEKDIPQPLIALKDMVPTPAPQSKVRENGAADTAVKKNKVLVWHVADPQKRTRQRTAGRCFEDKRPQNRTRGSGKKINPALFHSAGQLPPAAKRPQSYIGLSKGGIHTLYDQS